LRESRLPASHAKHVFHVLLQAGAKSRSRRTIGVVASPETYESNFIHHDFVQFGKQHSRYKVILPSIVLSQQCCEVYFISRTVAKPLWDLTTKYYWNRPTLPYWLDTPLAPCALYSTFTIVCFSVVKEVTWWLVVEIRQ